MNRIISCLVIIAMLLATVLAVIPASAEADEMGIYPVEEAFALPVVWGDLEYTTLHKGEDKGDAFTVSYDVSFDDRTIVTRSNSNTSTTKGDDLGYVSRTEYPITPDTYYVYEFKAKLNRTTGYAAVVLAADENNNHFFLGNAFANDGDHFGADGGRVSHIQLRQNNWDNNVGAYYECAGLPVLLDAEGFGTWRVIFAGLNLTVEYLDRNGDWKLANNREYAYTTSSADTVQNGKNWYDNSPEISSYDLPEGYYIAFGAHNRGGADSSERTITITDATLYDCKVSSENALDPADKSDLGEYIAYVESTYTDSALYESKSFATLQSALASAKESYAKEGLLQSEADRKLAALARAVGDLKADTTALNLLITEGRKLIKGNYTAESWQIFEDAFTAARGNTSTDVETVKAVYEALLAATEGLVPKELDKSELETLVTLGNLLVEDDFTADDWAEYSEKLAEATAVLEGATLQSDIDEAEKMLTRAIKSINGGVLPDLPVEEEPTEEPTDAPTEAPTAAPTDAPTDAPTEAPTAAPTEPAEESGCGGIIGASAVAVALLLGAVALKKKED